MPEARLSRPEVAGTPAAARSSPSHPKPSTSQRRSTAQAPSSARVRGEHELHCEELTDPATVQSARALVAQIYVEEGYLNESDVDWNGLPLETVDPYHRHSLYFGVSPQPSMVPLIAVSRIVLYDESRGAHSFPMLSEMTLADHFLDVVRAADLRNWAEVGSMAKRPGTTVQAPNLLYRKMWQRAVREGHATWLCAADQRVSRTLRNLFGDEIRPVGPRQHFMGSPTDPMVMNPPTSADWLAAQAVDSGADDSMVSQLVRLALAFFLEGLEPDYFTEAQLDRFEAGGANLRNSAVLDIRDDDPVINLTDKQGG